MRVRKPCLRARRRLFGWNVRFPFATIFSSRFHRARYTRHTEPVLKNLQMWVVNVSPPVKTLPTALFKALFGEHLAHGARHILTHSHIAAIDHDSLRSLSCVIHTDTQGHPKLHRCFYLLDKGTFMVSSCELDCASFSLDFPFAAKASPGRYSTRQRVQNP